MARVCLINSSDPFGLCPPTDNDPCPSMLAGALMRTGQLMQPAEKPLTVLASAALLFAGPSAVEGMGAEILGLGSAMRSGAGSGILTAGSVAQRVASATGGTVGPLQSSGGFRVSINGLGSFTREGALSSSQGSTHLSGLSTRELIDLVGIALQRVHVP
jgi:hypothetical protein